MRKREWLSTTNETEPIFSIDLILLGVLGSAQLYYEPKTHFLWIPFACDCPIRFTLLGLVDSLPDLYEKEPLKDGPMVRHRKSLQIDLMVFSSFYLSSLSYPVNLGKQWPYHWAKLSRRLEPHLQKIGIKE